MQTFPTRRFSFPLSGPAQLLLTSLRDPRPCLICIRSRTALCKLGSDLELGRLGLSTGEKAAPHGIIPTSGWQGSRTMAGSSQSLRGGLSHSQPLCLCHQIWQRFCNNSFRPARRWRGLEEPRRIGEDAEA